MMNRVVPAASPLVAITNLGRHVLDLLIRDNKNQQHAEAILSSYLTKITRLGGYRAREGSPTGHCSQVARIVATDSYRTRLHSIESRLI
jgi:hypothetical protein